MKIGLYFGSFNPVHAGHLIIANHILNTEKIDKLWFVISPQNPLKQTYSLLNEYLRMHLLNLAIGVDNRLKASDIEFKLPKPSYTVDTLTYLEEKYPQHQFVLLMGGDNLQSLDKWKNHEKIVEHNIYVYKRPGSNGGCYDNHPNIQYMDAPMLDISATYIRECIKQGLSIEYLVPDRVYAYLLNSRLYK